jgi:4-hydroxybenzoate polyprenyltransferase
MVDRADDLKIGVKSTAILFGKADRWIIGILQILFLLLLFVVGKVFQLNQFYYLSLVGAGILFIYQQILIKDAVIENYFKAFLNNNWVGCIIFLGIVLSYVNNCG